MRKQKSFPNAIFKQRKSITAHWQSFVRQNNLTPEKRGINELIYNAGIMKAHDSFIRFLNKDDFKLEELAIEYIAVKKEFLEIDPQLDLIKKHWNRFEQKLVKQQANCLHQIEKTSYFHGFAVAYDTMMRILFTSPKKVPAKQLEDFRLEIEARNKLNIIIFEQKERLN